MKKEVMYILLIVIMTFSFNIINVYAEDTSIDSVNTDVKEVVENNTLSQEKSKNDLISLNEPSNISNEEVANTEEENNSSNNQSNIIDEDINENVENDDEITNNEKSLTLDELNKLDDKLEFIEGILIVKGNLFDYTNTTLIKEIINKEEVVTKYNLLIQIIDKNNNIVTEDVIINDDFYLILKNESIEMKFKIAFLFDFDENYIVNEEDKVKLLELMAEDSTIIESENLSYFDYVLKNKTYDVLERGDISLDIEITTDKDRYDYGDEFDVTITNPQPPVEIIEEDNLPVEDQIEDNTSAIEEQSVNNTSAIEEQSVNNTSAIEEQSVNNTLETENDQISNNNPEEIPEKDPSEEEIPSEDEEDKKIYMNIISGKIDYDHDALKLLSITFEDYKNLSTEEDSYLFWVDNLETIRIVLRFKVINQNSREYITIYNSDICSEGKEIETERMRAKVILNKIPKPEPPKEYYVSKTEEKKVIREKRTDSYARKINIKNHMIRFSHSVKDYIIKADYSETSLDFEVILRDIKHATYKITGNNNFKVGENLVVVTVTAEDGSTTDYNFNVIRMAEEIIHNKKINNIGYDLLSMNIFLGALIVAIGLIYKLFSYKLNRF